eukprot:m.123941 g.123941  ORF g.123941 m.123941 type:complete len:460 (-) comp19723_c0_seq1:1765-3144(-)
MEMSDRDTLINDGRTPRTSAQQFRSYPGRWWVLFQIVLLQVGNAMVWITFASISDVSTKYYDTSYFVINLVSLTYLAAYIPFGPVSSYMLDTHGLRRSLVLASLINATGAWLRFAGDFLAAPHARLALVFVGQVLCAVAQPMVLSCPTLAADTWFSENQRATANTIASLSNPIGIALGSVLPPIVVSQGSDIRLLLLIFAIPNSLAALLVVLSLKDRPPTPPSASAHEKSEPFKAGLRSLIYNKQYLLLLTGFGLGVAVVNVISTLLGQMANGQGFNDNEAGLLGAALIVAGLVGAGVCGAIVDTYHAFRPVLKVFFFLACCSLYAFTYVLTLGSFAAAAVMAGVLGFFTFGILPVALELGVECTYPVSAGSSAGFLWLAGQALGIPLLLGCSAYAEQGKELVVHINNGTETKTYHDMTNPSYMLSGVATFALIFVLCFTSNYRRLEASQAQAGESWTA